MSKKEIKRLSVWIETVRMEWRRSLSYIKLSFVR